MTDDTDEIRKLPDKVLDLGKDEDSSEEVSPCAPPDEPPGYAHLPLSIVDSIYSLRQNYTTTTRPIVKRFAQAGQASLSIEGSLDVPLKAEPAQRFTVDDMAKVLADYDGDDALAADLFRARNTTGGVLKATVVRQAVEAFQRLGIQTNADLAANLGEAKSAWLGIKGLGRASWEYVTSLSGQQTVKPDTVLVKFVREELDRTVTPAEVIEILGAVLDEINSRCPSGSPWTARALDHYIWRWRSGRGAPDPD